jgi:hypothetical protein
MNMKPFQDQPYPSTATDSAQSTEAILGPLSLLPDQIEAPAFFVDKNLSIRWIATGGQDPFSMALAQELRSTASRHVFNLLLRPAIKHAIADWRSFFSFVYTNLRHAATPQAGFNPEFPFISREQIPPQKMGNTASENRHAMIVDSRLIGRDETAQRVFSMVFDKGTLFIFRQDRWQNKAPNLFEEAPAPQTTLPVAEKKTIGVLAARLNNSHGLAKTMLPERFLNLMNRIWQEADGIVRSLGGKRVACNGPQLCYVFSESAGRNPIFSAICCATRLNNQMALLEEKLNAQYGWVNEICLNMGIGHGADDQTASERICSLEFVIPGGAFDQSTLLSGIAGKEEIWITKDAAAQLPKDLVDQVVLGVDRQGKFLRHLFTRISDLQQARTVSLIAPEMEALSIARIRKLERQMPEQSIISEGVGNHVGRKSIGQGSC